jgi:hypothetical protein
VPSVGGMIGALALMQKYIPYLNCQQSFDL